MLPESFVWKRQTVSYRAESALRMEDLRMLLSGRRGAFVGRPLPHVWVLFVQWERGTRLSVFKSAMIKKLDNLLDIESV